MNNGKHKLSFDHPKSLLDGSRSTAVLVISLESGYVIGSGVARCSCDDQFDKSVGRKIALTRAIKHLPRNEREQIWSLYWDNVRS